MFAQHAIWNRVVCHTAPLCLSALCSTIVTAAAAAAIAAGTDTGAASGITLTTTGEPVSVPALALPAPLSDVSFLAAGEPDRELVELGRHLFFDPILSGNRNIACGTCHDPLLGTGDGLALGIGEGGIGRGPERRTGPEGVIAYIPRNAQPLYNIGALEYRSMFHDGRVEFDPERTFASGFWTPARDELPDGLGSLLAAQAMFPVLSHTEMSGQKGENAVATAVAEERFAGEEGAWQLLADRLQQIPDYVRRFKAAFDEIDDVGAIDFTHAARALAAFQSVAFRSDNSPFDQVLKTGNSSELTAEARHGMTLFYGKAACAECHSGPLLTDHSFHAIAMPQIGPGKGHGADTSYWRNSGFNDRLEDEGRYRITFDPEDRFRFRTPSLRNVAQTGPWGHAGAYTRLTDVVRHHVNPLRGLERYDRDMAENALVPLDAVIEQTGLGSRLIFRPLNPVRREDFVLRDSWVQSSETLRGRIAEANALDPVVLADDEVSALVAFLESLTDPDARDLSHWIPKQVPSGLPPQPTLLSESSTAVANHP